MMAFSDGIKPSRPAAVSHANCIVCRVFLSQNRQQSVLFDAFFFSIFVFFSSLLLLVPLPYRNVIICSPAAPLGNASDVPSFHLPPSPCALFVSPAGLPPLLHGLLQHLQHPHAVSASRSSVWKLPLPLLQAKLDKCRLLFFFSKSFQRELRWWKCQPSW